MKKRRVVEVVGQQKKAGKPHKEAIMCDATCLTIEIGWNELTVGGFILILNLFYIFLELSSKGN